MNVAIVLVLAVALAALMLIPPRRRGRRTTHLGVLRVRRAREARRR